MTPAAASACGAAHGPASFAVLGALSSEPAALGYSLLTPASSPRRSSARCATASPSRRRTAQRFANPAFAALCDAPEALADQPLDLPAAPLGRRASCAS
jgi:hypothetical protein